VNAASAGTYTVTFRVAAPSAVTDAFHITNSSGTNLTGNINIPATGGFQAWTNVTATLTLAAGEQTLTVNQDNGGWNLNFMSFTSGGGGGVGEGPYGGTPAAIPGTLMVENYDTGSQGVGYNVTSVNGTDNSYRSDGVDLETASCPATGNDLGWTAAGQWFKYTVNVSTAGTVTFLVAAESAVSDAFHLSNSSGANLTGLVAVPNTGNWQTWTTVTATLTLPAGTQTLTLNQDNAGWNIDAAELAESGSVGPGTEGPYGGKPAAIPGAVMNENYDTGGQGVAYNVTSTNGTDNGYRTDGDDVDLETASSPATGNDLGWTAAGQWFKYTVNVSTAGTYTVTFLVAAESAVSDAFHLSNSSGANLTGSVAVPNTGNWQTWTTVTATLTLPAGTQTLTLNQDNAGWNIDAMAFALGSTGGGPPPARLFAPYEYVGDLSDANQIDGIVSASGAKAVILAFLDPDNNGCSLIWPGANGPLPNDTVGSTSMGSVIAQLQSQGVTVIISGGGAGALDGSTFCGTAAEVQALYQSVINQYHVHWLDFDIETPETSGQSTRRAQALAALQAANPGLIISYTLLVHAAAWSRRTRLRHRRRHH
jgi:hypothetical protein